MKSNKQVVGLLKAIYFVTISIAMILIGFFVSGGEYNAVTAVLFFAGIACLLVGVFMGIANFTAPKDDNK